MFNLLKKIQWTKSLIYAYNGTMMLPLLNSSYSPEVAAMNKEMRVDKGGTCDLLGIKDTLTRLVQRSQVY